MLFLRQKLFAIPTATAENMGHYVWVAFSECLATEGSVVATVALAGRPSGLPLLSTQWFLKGIEMAITTEVSDTLRSRNREELQQPRYTHRMRQDLDLWEPLRFV